MATPVLLDCDPGHDDAVAILLAAGNDAIDVRAITSVAGNCPLDLATLVAKVDAVGPKGFVTDLSLLENRFEFQRHLARLRPAGGH